MRRANPGHCVDNWRQSLGFLDPGIDGGSYMKFRSAAANNLFYVSDHDNVKRIHTVHETLDTKLF
jgi:hypothetical protein